MIIMQADSSAILEAQEAPHASVRQRATRVLELLGVSDRKAAQSTKAAPPASQSAAVPDLLGGLDNEPTQQANSERQATGGELLGKAISDE